MDAIKRASFASKQLRAGPAPLASFEDLPSDELESPEDNVYDESDDLERETPERSQLSSTVTSISTPDTVILSSQSTPHIESDIDSQFSQLTLTPSESSKTPLVTDVNSSSFSSLTKEDTFSVKQKSVPTSNQEVDQTNNYETDVFHSHNENNICQDKKEKVKKKSKFEMGKIRSDVKTKEKGKFLSMFKVKKGGKNSNSLVSPEEINGNLQHDANINELNRTICDEKENESPKKIQLHPMQVQNDLDKSTSFQNSFSKSTQNNKQNDLNSVLNISEKEELNISVNETENIKAINEEEKDTVSKTEEESSESEVGYEAKAKSLAQKGNEIEAETLISQDEIDEDSLIEISPLVFKVPSSMSNLLSRQQRQDVTTIPIERPRSTTPINLAPLEAFIRSASPSFDAKAEKIKLSLPGEQFLGRLKSPKRSSSKSWTDFCVEVLHSPHFQRRDDFSEQLEDLLSPSESEKDKTSCWDKFDIPEKQWVTFETSTREENRPDLISLTETKRVGEGDAFESQEPNEQLSKCPCQCHCDGCDNMYISYNKDNFVSDTTSPKIDLFSDKCQCQCHEKYLHLWSPTNFLGDGDFSLQTDDSLTLPSVDAVSKEKI